MQAEKKAVKTCPLCRQPLSQVMRHGRILNKMKIDQADIKFAGQCNMLLDNADSLFQQAVAATEQVDQLGMPQSWASVARTRKLIARHWHLP